MSYLQEMAGNWFVGGYQRARGLSAYVCVLLFLYMGISSWKSYYHIA